MLEFLAPLGIKGITSLLGGSQANRTADEAQREYQRIMQEILQQYQGLEAPELAQLQAQYQAPELVANFQAESLGPSAFEDIAIDPRIQQAQNEALQGLADRSKMGMTPADMEAYNQIKNQMEARRKSQMAQVETDAARRGMTGSGGEEVRRMMAMQDAQNVGQQQADRLAAQNYEARQQALRDMGAMGSQMRGQQFQEQSATASAKDQQAQLAAKWRNDANQMNQQYAQQNANERANVANQQAQQNARAYGDRFQMQQGITRDLASLQSGIAGQNLGFAKNQADRQYNTWDTIGDTVGGVAYNYFNPKKRV